VEKTSQHNHLLLPYPPSVNKSTTVCHGRKIKSPAARKWAKQAREEIALQWWSKVNGPCRIVITLYPSTKHKFDPDNRIKSILDALVDAGVIEDDNSSIAFDTRVRMGVTAPKAFCLVEIEAVPYHAEPLPEGWERWVNGIVSIH